MQVSILGTLYTLYSRSEKDDARFQNAVGLCDETTKELIVRDTADYEGDILSKGNLSAFQQKVIRHEIVHAFLCESGLAEESAWAQNEEMVDWVARQGPQIIEAWKQAGALPQPARVGEET